MAQQFSQYSKKEFRTRREAEKWGEQQKTTLKQAELGGGVAKVDIDFNEKMGGTWVARILIPV